MEYELSYEYECLVPIQSEEPTDEELIQMYFTDNNEAS